MMLRHSFGLEAEADAVESAVGAALDSGVRTADIACAGGKTVSTAGMGEAIIAALSGF